jgi:hypothetical protein
MPCKWLKEDGSCDKPGPEKVCGQWPKWFYCYRRFVLGKCEDFCKDNKYKKKWGK